MFILISLLKILIIIVPLLISVAYFTLAERKILGAIQRRRGPNVVGVYGLLQPLSDGFKLLVKETVLPSNANKFIFILAPIITFVISLMGWAIIPYDKYSVLSEVNVGVLYLFAISSLGVYGIIMSGWASNSKYAFLGALRSAAQMVSYEVSIGFIIVTIVVCCGSFNLQTIIESQRNVWFIIPFFPLFLMFFISALAETNRHPFDLPEAEAEIVSGYNVEYLDPKASNDADIDNLDTAELAETPSKGADGEVDFELNSEMGYNLDETLANIRDYIMKNKDSEEVQKMLSDLNEGFERPSPELKKN
jgi:NADH-quinone oxidoreductase subunit H